MKSVLAALLAMAMCAGMVGCGNKPPKDINDWTDEDFENAANQLEEQYDKDKKDKDDKPAKSEEVEYAPTDEIINADIRSGLVQFNNDVFQQGGYITVADFVEKYKENYEINYVYYDNGTKQAPYEDCKEYLLEYIDMTKVTSRNLPFCLKHRFILMPKYGNKSNKFIAYIANATSPEEKITLNKGIVLFCDVMDEPNHVYTNTPIWIPNGLTKSTIGNFNLFTMDWKMPEDIKSENENYNPKAFTAMLDENGFEKEEDLTTFRKNQENKYYYDGNGLIYFSFVGEPNLFGAKPYYDCTANFNPNTDKLKDVKYSIQKFIIE